MARRLPIYLLLDTSNSMSGEPITAVQNGVQMVISALQNDPQALETAYISIITFESVVKQIIPLTELSQFTPPQLIAGGCTSMGEALKFVSESADKEIMKNTPDTKGDWKPMVFIMTDGAPTDDFDSGLEVFKAHKWGMVVACAVEDADEKLLKRITENVVKLSTADAESIKAFFKWVSQSITMNSKSVGATNQEITSIDQLPPPPPEISII
jgi:uncharacterized protein YegL